MEGSWGRRIFGTIERGETWTRFKLILDTRDRNQIYQGFFARNSDLEHDPKFYGVILDMMVFQMEQASNHPVE